MRSTINPTMKVCQPNPLSGMLTFMNALPFAILKEMAFTAKPLSSARAERLGVINHLVAADQLATFTCELAQAIVENAPLSISIMKEQLRMLAGIHPLSPRRFERVQRAEAYRLR